MGFGTLQDVLITSYDLRLFIPSFGKICSAPVGSNSGSWISGTLFSFVIEAKSHDIGIWNFWGDFAPVNGLYRTRFMLRLFCSVLGDSSLFEHITVYIKHSYLITI